jgi:hypothetical protein
VGYHRQIIKGLPIEGRCIGHGGMPVEIDQLRNGEEMIAFYDQRKRTTLRRIGVGYNGFAWLTFQKERLTIEYCDMEDQVVVSEKWKIDMDTGILRKGDTVSPQSITLRVDPNSGELQNINGFKLANL